MNSVRRVLERMFPEQRELIVRSGGRVRYVRLGRPAQFAVSGLALGALVWTGFATDRFLDHDAFVSSLDAEIDDLRTRNTDLAAALNDSRTRLEIRNRSLTATQRTTVDLATSNRALNAEVARLKERLDDAHARANELDRAYRDAEEARSLAQAAAGELERARSEIASRLDAGEKRLADVAAERDSLRAEVAQLQVRIGDLKENVGTLDGARTDLIARLNAAERRLRAATEERLRVEGDREDLGAQVAELSGRLETIEAAQLEVVARLGEQAGQSGEALRRTLDLAGLDVERLLDRMARGDDGGLRGIGGPFVAIDGVPGSDLAERIAAVERRIDDLASLQELMERLPLAAPLDEYRVTSGFGRRVDPFTSGLALHSGLDLASRRSAPVHVTSPGVVTFVGWKGGFGKLVEVDHGLGVRTRYAHLSKIFVKHGQKLEFREKIGFVGNTGRSSGEHLHYEVIVDGRPNDPANFIKAGQYVFKK